MTWLPTIWTMPDPFQHRKQNNFCTAACGGILWSGVCLRMLFFFTFEFNQHNAVWNGTESRCSTSTSKKVDYVELLPWYQTFVARWRRVILFPSFIAEQSYGLSYACALEKETFLVRIVRDTKVKCLTLRYFDRCTFYRKQISVYYFL